LLRFHRTRGFHRLIPRHGNEGIQRWVVSFNALEASLSEFDGRCSFAAKQLRSFLQRQAGQVVRFARGGLQSQADGRSRDSYKKASATVKVRLHFRVGATL
jgi:hypothetical protein